MSVDFERIRELIATIAATDLTEVALKSNDFELTVRKTPPTPQIAAVPEGMAVAATLPVAEAVATGTAAPPAAATEPAAPRKEEKLLEILSPMVGTFYRAPAPGESPFINVGDRVRTGQTVCIIEAMKLMNEIESEAEGEVIEICVENAEPVEYGQALMRVRLP